MSCRVDFFLRQARLQCRWNSTGKRVKSTRAFAGTVDVGIVVHDFYFSFLIRDKISFLSTMQILHWSVLADFIQRILSPYQIFVGTIISFSFFRTSLLLLHSLQQSSSFRGSRKAGPSDPFYPLRGLVVWVLNILYKRCDWDWFFYPLQSWTLSSSLLCFLLSWICSVRVLRACTVWVISQRHI